MRLFSRPLANTARTAIIHTPAIAAAAVVELHSGAKPELLHLASETREQGGLHWTTAQQLLKSMPRREAPVSALLSPGNYQLLQADAANVPAAELREAMRWKIRDLIDQPPESMTIDVFPMPPRPQLGTARQMFVVAAEKWRVEEQCAMVRGAARRLDVVDIPEMAWRNLMALVPGEAEGCALLVIARGFVQILVSRGGSLYVVRRIDGSVAHDPERIGLDVQRSLQYYESHFDRAPLARLYVAPANEQAETLAPLLAAATGLQVEALPVATLVNCAATFPVIDQPELLLALGAALRPAAVTVQ